MGFRLGGFVVVDIGFVAVGEIVDVVVGVAKPATLDGIIEVVVTLAGLATVARVEIVEGFSCPETMLGVLIVMVVVAFETTGKGLPWLHPLFLCVSLRTTNIGVWKTEILVILVVYV